MTKIRLHRAFVFYFLCVLCGSTLLLADESAPPRSEPYTWQNVTIVAGGFMPGIEFNPAQAGLAYIRADMGGAYRWDKDQKVWVPLVDWSGISDWNNYGIESLAIDPSDPDRVFIAAGTYTNQWAGNGRMLRSGDQGRSWQSTPMPFKMGGNEPGRSMGERMAVDPNDRRVLYFGSRHNGLWSSTDSGVTWNQVKSFPVKGTRRGLGIGFVLYDSRSGPKGEPTPTIYAGVEEGDVRLYLSKDAGQTWSAVPGQPEGLMPQHAVLASDGTLYISYTNAPGPNDVKNGAVWKLNTASGEWTDISPVKPMGTGDNQFGYSGLTVDAHNPQVVMVGTLDHWQPADDVFRSIDGGATWKSTRESSVLDPSASPFLKWGDLKPKFGWWIGSVEIDPFDSNRVMYVTGATVWGCDDISEMDAGRTVHWSVQGQGIEECAVNDLISPPIGPHLLSALGDVGGFRHDDFTKSPASGMMSNPIFSTTTGIDESVDKPSLVVRTGNSSTMHGAYSTDIGATWTPFASEPAGADGGTIALSADGSTLVWAPYHAPVSFSTDMGKSWTACKGIDGDVMVISDPTDSNCFYAVDSQGGNFYVSTDGGKTFTAKTGQLPKPSSRLRVLPGHPNEILLPAEDMGLWVSTNMGATFTKLPGVEQANAIGFGAPPPGKTDSAFYLSGKVGGIYGVFRSDDIGASWIRINDDAHQYGWPHTVTGDPRIFGRVYLGTNGRGILYADPAK